MVRLEWGGDIAETGSHLGVGRCDLLNYGVKAQTVRPDGFWDVRVLCAPAAKLNDRAFLAMSATVAIAIQTTVPEESPWPRTCFQSG